MIPFPPQFRPGAVRSRDVVDGFIRQIPYLSLGQIKRFSCQLVLLGKVCCKNTLVISTDHRRMGNAVPEPKMMLVVRWNCLTFDVWGQTELQRYLVFPHKVHQVLGSSLRGAEKCPMPDSVRKQIQEDLCFFYLVWNLKKSRERASITSFSGS